DDPAGCHTIRIWTENGGQWDNIGPDGVAGKLPVGIGRSSATDVGCATGIVLLWIGNWRCYCIPGTACDSVRINDSGRGNPDRSAGYESDLCCRASVIGRRVCKLVRPVIVDTDICS